MYEAVKLSVENVNASAYCGLLDITGPGLLRRALGESHDSAFIPCQKVIISGLQSEEGSADTSITTTPSLKIWRPLFLTPVISYNVMCDSSMLVAVWRDNGGGGMA